MKHAKHSSILTFYSTPVAQDELDTLSNFDDRTLASLAGTKLDDGGVDHENTAHALGLDRWQDRHLRIV